MIKRTHSQSARTLNCDIIPSLPRSTVVISVSVRVRVWVQLPLRGLTALLSARVCSKLPLWVAMVTGESLKSPSTRESFQASLIH